MSTDTPHTSAMSSSRPYLLRALIEWINDNLMTPHILVDASVNGVRVPSSAIKDGRVVLNIAERAVTHLHMDNQTLSFSARFAGVSFPVSVPIAAVLAVYARENGQGMVLPPDETTQAQPSPPDNDHLSEQPAPPPAPAPDAPTPTPPSAGKRAHLRVIK